MNTQRTLGSLATGVASLLAVVTCSTSAVAQCQDKLLAGSATPQDQFGLAVAQSSRYAVVGALFEAGSGAAYVYEPAGGGWRQSGRLQASAPTGTDQFGSTVAVSGNTVVVGASFSDVAPLQFTGSAHVFEPDGSGWLETQTLHASDLESGDQFGISVSVDGNWLAVGAPFKEIPGVASAGAVYLFERQAGTWVEVDRVNASDAATGDSFGLSVSLSGDSLFVGAPFDDDGGTSSGSTYLFQFDGISWNETQKLTASSPDPSDEFGRQVAVSGDIAIIGARNDDDGGVDTGAAYAYERTGSSWVFAQKLKSSLPLPNDRFGTCVGAGDGMLAAGSPFANGVGVDRGCAHLFRTNGGGWVEFKTVHANDATNSDRFGMAVAVGGGRLLIGAPQNDEAGSNSGAAYGVPFAGADSDNDGTLDACEQTPFLNFCLGDGGQANGCTACECGNDAPRDSAGGCLNSAGSSAQLVPSGVPSLLADTFRIDMTGSNPSTFALLVAGINQLPSNVASPCFDSLSGVRSTVFDGLRCVGGSIVRLGVRATDPNGDVGAMNTPWGNHSTFILDSRFVAGETRYFQSFYREDPLLVCGRGLNTTQAFSVTFQP